MMATKRTVIAFSELNRLAVECAKCGARLVFDVDRMVTVSRPDRGNPPGMCPSCEKSFGNLTNVIGRFFQVFVDANASENKLSFEIEEKT